MSDRESSLSSRLSALRSSPTRRRFATLVGLLLGIWLSTFHWLGLVAGGAMTALPQPSLRRGVAAGFGFGVVAWLVFLGTLWWGGVGALYLEMGQVAVVTGAVSLSCGLLGGLARGLG